MRQMFLSMLALALCSCAPVDVLRKNFCFCPAGGSWTELTTPPARANELAATAWASAPRFGMKLPTQYYWYEANRADLVLCIPEPHDEPSNPFGSVELFTFSQDGSHYSLVSKETLLIRPE
jgi:hypothetical protein